MRRGSYRYRFRGAPLAVLIIEFTFAPLQYPGRGRATERVKQGGGKEVSNVVRVRGLDCYVCIPEVLSKSKTIDQLLVVILSWTLFNAT